MKSKRKLVEIDPKQHKILEDIREECRKNSGLVPTIPNLVKAAIERGLPALREQFLPAPGSQK